MLKREAIFGIRSLSEASDTFLLTRPEEVLNMAHTSAVNILTGKHVWR